AGDGNLHANVLFDRPEERAKVDQALHEMASVAIALGGTITGEHGVGLAKRELLALEQSPPVLELQRRLKAVFDPDGLFTPGKLCPAGPDSRDSLAIPTPWSATSATYRSRKSGEWIPLRKVGKPPKRRGPSSVEEGPLQTRRGPNHKSFERRLPPMASAARSESLSSYLRQIGGRPQLTREQEYELARRARKGDSSARDTLALSNLPFVVAVAKKFAHRGARLDDLVQEGNVGLMKAIEHFDPKKNVRFATYAVWWIRAYITRYLKDNRSQ